MKLTSWNCRGFGSRIKEEALKDIIRISKSEILLVQETKMEEKDFLNTTKALWKTSQGIAESARGASGGLGTLWNTMKFDLIKSETRMHWIYTNLLHKESGRLVSLFNLYVSVLLEEKRTCWDTLKDYLLLNDLENIIIGGDLNVTLACGREKRGLHCARPGKRMGRRYHVRVGAGGCQTN
jgi:exonuclease III